MRPTRVSWECLQMEVSRKLSAGPSVCLPHCFRGIIKEKINTAVDITGRDACHPLLPKL